MNTIIAIGAAHSFFLYILIRMKKNQLISDKILGFLFFILGITYGIGFISYQFDDIEFLLLLENIDLLIAPLFFLYIKSLIQKNFRIRYKEFFHFLLYLLTIIYLIIFFTSIPSDEYDKLIFETPIYDLPVLFIIMQILEMVAIPVYVLWSFDILKEHQQNISENYSYKEGIDYRWANTFLYVILLMWLLLSVTSYWSEVLDVENISENIQVGFTLGTFLIFYLGFWGLRQTKVFIDIDFNEQKTDPQENQQDIDAPEKQIKTEKSKYIKSGLTKDKSDELKQTLLNYMENKKPYLQCKLSISDLADQLGISSHYLSEIINLEFEQSFYDFINSYRINEFIEKLKDNSSNDITLLGLAFDSGFNSKSSFNRIFKKFTGLTPSEYASQINKKES